MGDLTNEDFTFMRAKLALTERSGIYLTKREVRGLLDMAERCAKAEKAAGELLRACTTAQRILAEYGEDNREIDEAIARAQSGQLAQRETPSPWLPIDTAPSQGPFLVLVPGKGAVVTTPSDGWLDDEHVDPTPTHWMPLWTQPSVESAADVFRSDGQPASGGGQS